MRRIKRAALIGLPAVALLAVAWSTVRFRFYSAPDPAVSVDAPSTAYFLDSYASCREAFRGRAARLTATYPDATLSAIPVPGRKDDDLAVDVLHIPARRDHRRLLVLSSGVHGVEGFVGSALQCMFLDEFVSDPLLDTTGVLVIHGMNPYGFKHLRRFSENNVDLNRNCDTDSRLFSTTNAGYRSLTGLINPETKVATRSAGNLFFHLRVVAHIVPTSMKSFRQAVAQGQYEFPRGILFGGRAFEPQVRGLAPVVERALNDYPLVMNIDLHTGYGERGTLHLFPNPIADPAVRAMMEGVFQGCRIDWGDGDDFYTVTGEFSSYLGKLARKGAYLPMTFEYGSLNSQTILGSIKTLHITSLENQGFHFGYASKEDEERVKRDFRELFYPSSPFWRSKVMHDTRAALRTCLANFGKL